MGSADSRKAAVADELTVRQAECIRYAGEGMSSKEIGRLLGIAPSTVDNHIHIAVAKLHAKNRWQAAQLLHPKRTIPDPEGQYRRRRWLPPLGGGPNLTPPRDRFLQIISIAVVALIVLAAIISSIVAVVYVFSPS